jgi:demethylmenaquinone methyltransferase/2-methoxy-6-polyprenyl-1,4-benzoquinol methylase
MTETGPPPKVTTDINTNSVGQMFDSIAPVYDRLNHILSFGQDYYWRRKLADCVDKESKLRMLDLATGTGDVLISLLTRNFNITEAIGLDVSANMLTLCREKIERHKLSDRVKLVHADATLNPLENETFDLITISFGIRNTTDIYKTLMEIFRLLRPGGKILILEFSMPTNPILKPLYLLYLNYLIPIIGRLYSGNKHAYKHLSTSINNFIGTHLASLMHDVGFEQIHSTPMTFGIVCLYKGFKPKR